MLLQLACDSVTSKEAVERISKIKDHVDIIEAGTPLMVREGVAAVEKLKNAFPDKLVLADIKIMDGASLESSLCFDAGADIVSLLALTNPSTVEIALNEANRRGKAILADLMQVPNVLDTALSLESMGVKYICVHASTDSSRRLGGRFKGPFEDLSALSGKLTKSSLCVAGRIDFMAAKTIMSLRPDVLVVGSAILSSPDIEKSAAEISTLIKSLPL
jgi:3-hexulose-6-phosphate synthase